MAVGLYMIIRSAVMSKINVFWQFSDTNNGNWFKENSTSSYYEGDGSNKTGRLAINFGSYHPIREADDTIIIPIATHTTKATSLTASNALMSFNANGFNYSSYYDSYTNSYLIKRAIKNSLTLTKTTITVSGTTYTVYASNTFTIDTSDNTKIINLQGAMITPSQGQFQSLDGYHSNLMCLAGQKLNGLAFEYSVSTFPDYQLSLEQYLSYTVTIASGSTQTCEYRPQVDSITLRNASFTDIVAPSFTSGESGYDYVLFSPTTEALPTSTVQIALVKCYYSTYAVWKYKDHSSNVWINVPIQDNNNPLFIINDDYGSSGFIDLAISLENHNFYTYNDTIKIGYALTNGSITSIDNSTATNRYNSNVQNNGILTNGYITFTYDSSSNLYIATLDISDSTADCKIISIYNSINTFNTTNCTSQDVFNYFFQSQLIDNISAIANEGYVFTTTPTYNNETYTYTATLSNDDMTATFTNILTPVEVYSTPSINFSADVQPTPVITTYPFVLVYSPTNNELNNIAGLRFSYIYSATSEIIDLGNYIIDLYKTFMPLIKSRLKYIVKMFTIDTGIASYMIEEQTSVADCGDIELFELYKNNVDYNETELSIYLPFNGIEKLDTEKYMGKTINLKYIADILTGDCNIILSVYNDNIEDYEIVDIFNCNVSYKVPYKINSNFREGAIGEFKTNALMLIDKTPYIKIERPENSYTGLIDDETRNTIGTFTGYGLCKFTDIKISNYNEGSYNPVDYKEIENMIIDLLQEGIIL